MAREALTLSPRERIEFLSARALGALPAHVQVRLSGKTAVTADGDTLAADLQLALVLQERRGWPKPETLPPAQARAERRRLAAVYAGKRDPVGSVRDLEIDTDAAVLRARHYTPTDTGDALPLLVYYHGGGFTYGDLDTHDGSCRLLCRYSGAHVLAIDYRLAPEHPFPAAVQDAREALRWAISHAGELGADPQRVGVGGDSAGGNLAAVVSQIAARDGGPAPVLQLLIYPVTDFTRQTGRSRELFGEGFLLTTAEMEWFEQNYLGGDVDVDAADPRVSPLFGEDLSGLAPAIVVTAAFDPLRDEGEKYAHAMRAAGTPVTLLRLAGFIHAFINLAGVSRACREAVIEIAGMTRAMLAIAPAQSPAARAS
jgi:acetyl esterase